MAGTAHLRKFSTTFYKDKVSGTDIAQVPASSASVKVYKQGATVTSGNTVTVGGISLTVRSVGRILSGDTVQLGTDASKQMTVDSITSDTVIVIHSTIGSSIVVNAGDRLVPYSNLPTIYSESTGVANIANPATTSSTGYVEFYAPEARFDTIVSGSGLTDTLYKDNESGWLRGGTAWINVKDYATFQAAVDAVSSYVGGTKVFVPLGNYSQNTTPAFNGITISKQMILEGEDQVLAGAGVVLRNFTAGAEALDSITISAASGVVIRNLAIQGEGSIGAGIGIKWFKASTDLIGLTLENLLVFDSPSWGFSAVPTSGNIVSKLVMIGCTFATAKSSGSVIVGGPGGTNNLFFERCEFNGPSTGTYGITPMDRGNVHLDTVAIARFSQCSFQVSTADSTAISMTGSCRMVTLRDTYIEFNVNGTSKYAITTSGNVLGLIVDSLYFLRNPTAIGPRLIKTDTNGTVYMAKIANAYIGHRESSPQTDDVVLGHVDDNIYFENLWVHNNNSGASRELKITASRPNVGLIGAFRGFEQLKIPGVPSTATITAPTAGSLIYNKTDNKFYAYNGTSWIVIGNMT